ncbi:VapE domain-containing protein [Thermodesulfovibrio yellowstonii]|uniref:Virulence-associated protein E-like domain-containing protein n=1 Tax=Thermodesulfovibrio yellowstonii TaxID=28262 RepID=A0A9W6GET0_9BACT|nr:VapE domain-containing protein [Thermodesulfovibrio islandicus]GLI53979.1 hypothetical protein TISLANDTSLP1_16720 [Thermodesulfovibrio islandicus]
MIEFEIVSSSVEKLNDFLRQIKQSQINKNIHIVFPSLCQKLRNNFILIPSNGKVPNFKYYTEEDKKISNAKKIENSALLLLPSWLAVIDIDDVTLFCKEFATSVDEIERVANIKTGKGYHVYIFDPLKSIKSVNKSVNFIKSYGFEILRNENDLVMLPGSRIYHERLQKNVFYEVINTEILSVDDIGIHLFLKNCLSIAEQGNGNGHGNKENINKENRKTKIDLDKLSKIIKKYYKHGDRQNTCIYTAGLLAKNGIDIDTAIAIVSEIASSAGDSELRMRIGGVRHTYQDFESGKDVKGISGLKELGIEEIEEVFSESREKDIKINIPTVTELLREFCHEHNIQIDYDEFYVKIFVNNKEIDREIEVKIQSELEKKVNKRISDDVFLKAVESIAYEHKRDRLKEFLIECKAKWDGISRIHAFFHDVFETPISLYSVNVSKNFFVSAVARAFCPGCFQKNIVVIQGPQNIGKSRALMALGREFHREINVSISTEKDFYMAIQGVWLAEIPEMDALRKADRNRIKAIISSTVDRFRPPYSRQMKDFPRRCVFTCTTNDQTIYDDPTGGTRFWLIEALQKANIEYIEQYRELLFGEAVWELEKGYKYWEVNEQEAQEIQENARRHDEWEEIISEYIEKNRIERTTVAEIAEKALYIPMKDLDKTKQMRIAECLTVLGFTKRTIREGTKTKKVWLKFSDSIQPSQEIDPF